MAWVALWALEACTPVLRPRTVAAIAAQQEMRCGLARIDAIDGRSFQATSRCGEVRYYRCRSVLHVDCHGHEAREDTVGLFHPGHAPGHSPR